MKGHDLHRSRWQTTPARYLSARNEGPESESHSSLRFTVDRGLEESRTDLPALNQYLASRGYAVAAVSYRFAPEIRHPSQIDDINRSDRLPEEQLGEPRCRQYSHRAHRPVGWWSTRAHVGVLEERSCYSRSCFVSTARRISNGDGTTPPIARVYNTFNTLRSFLGGQLCRETRRVSGSFGYQIRTGSDDKSRRC